MFCSDTLIRGQGAQLEPFIPWIRRWLIFGSFTPGCVLLDNGVLPLYLPSPSWNSGHYPQFPFIHLFSLLLPYTLSPGWGLVLPFSPLILFPQQVASFWLFWPFTHLFFPWATVISLGLTRWTEETDQQCPGEEMSEGQIPRLHSPESSSRPENSIAFPVFLSSPAKKDSNCFLTSWLLQLSPQNWDILRFKRGFYSTTRLCSPDPGQCWLMVHGNSHMDENQE